MLTNQVEPQVVRLIQNGRQQKITGINWLFLAPGYTEQVAKALADSQQPIPMSAPSGNPSPSRDPRNEQSEWIAGALTSRPTGR